MIFSPRTAAEVHHSAADSLNPSKLSVFFHVYPVNHWRDIVEEVSRAAGRSELATDDRIRSMLLGLAGSLDEPGVERYKAMSSEIDRHWMWDKVLVRSDGTEWPTLEHLHNHCQHYPDDLVLYVHTKGVSKSGAHDRKPGAADDLRLMMTYFCVEQWRDAVKVFDAQPEVQVAGCNIKDKRIKPRKLEKMQAMGLEIPPSMAHFSGNFWWARASHVAKLPRPYSEEQKLIVTWRGLNPRYQAERWVMLGLERHQMHQLYKAYDGKGRPIDHTSRRWPRERYEKDR
jgi:hypothetical protein